MSGRPIKRTLRGPAAGGALGPELPDLVVLEVGVDERPQGPPGDRERRAASRQFGDEVSTVSVCLSLVGIRSTK